METNKQRCTPSGFGTKTNKDNKIILIKPNKITPVNTEKPFQLDPAAKKDLDSIFFM